MMNSQTNMAVAEMKAYKPATSNQGSAVLDKEKTITATATKQAPKNILALAGSCSLISMFLYTEITC